MVPVKFVVETTGQSTLEAVPINKALPPSNDQRYHNSDDRG